MAGNSPLEELVAGVELFGKSANFYHDLREALRKALIPYQERLKEAVVNSLRLHAGAHPEYLSYVNDKQFLEMAFQIQDDPSKPRSIIEEQICEVVDKYHTRLQDGASERDAAKEVTQPIMMKLFDPLRKNHFIADSTFEAHLRIYAGRFKEYTATVKQP